MDFNPVESLNLSDAAIHFFQDILIVLGIGLLIGLEREYAKSQQNEDSAQEMFAGVRTFPLVGIIGYLAIYIGDRFSFWIYPVVLGGVILLTIVAYYLSRLRKRVGATTELAFIATFLLSSLVYLEEYLLSAFLALLITALLAFKVNLHKAISTFSRKDILSILLFAVITVLILPLLPNKDFGPYGVLNPFKIWLIVTIFIALNFVAYFLHKFIDSRHSILTTGVLGGFVSSTATTWYLSRLGGRTSEGGMTQIAAITLASSIMFPRLLVWLIVLSPELFSILWLPITIFGALGFSIGLYYIKLSTGEHNFEERKITNPINFKDALFFALLYILILLLVGFAKDYLGSKGVFLAAGLSGLTDVDAITISLSNYANQSIQLSVASVAIIIAAFSNTLVKFAICLVFGNRIIRRYAGFAFGSLFAAGLAYVLYLLI